MRSHAKATSAFTQGRVGLIALAFAMVCSLWLVNATSASAAKYFDSTIGTPGSTVGGTFGNAPRDVAVNDPSINDGNANANGDIYIVDDANHRIQRLNANGTFDLAWGADVVQTGKTGDVVGTNPFEICTVASECKVGVSSAGNGATSGNGSLANPQGIAIDQDTGNVYVSDRNNRRINQYTADGAFLRSFGFDVAASGPGNSGTSYEICVGADGDVCKVGLGVNNASATSPGPNSGQYSAGTTTNGYRIDVSKPDGNVATGKVFLANTGSRRVETFNLDGTSPSNFGKESDFGTNHPLNVAVDKDGMVYATNSANSNSILRYDTAAGTPGFLAAINVSGLSGNTSGRAGIEVDRVSGNLFVVSGSATAPILEISTPGAFPALAGTYSSETPAGTFTPAGLGINPDTGRLFVPATATSGGLQGRTVVFDQDGVGPISASLQPATNVATTTADLHATINPSPSGPTGLATSYRFEVSTNGEIWTAVTSNTLVPPDGDTNAAAAVQAQATKLEPNTLFQVRVVATRASNAGAAIATGVTLLTQPAVPDVTTVHAFAVFDTSASLAGEIDPNSQETEYYFKYGTDTNYGQSTPVESAGSGATPKAVVANLTDLLPETAYHFKLVASNNTGTVESPDATFVTASPCQNADRRTGLSAKLPNCRAYELVSPPDKGGLGAVPDESGGGALATSDGKGILYAISGTLPEAEGAALFVPHIARRGGDTWDTTSVQVPFDAGTIAAEGFQNIAGASADLSKTVVYSNQALTDDAWKGGVQVYSYYVRDTDTGVLRLLTPTAVSGSTPYRANFMAGSSDYEQLLIETNAALTPDAVGLPGGTEDYKLYKWDDGELTLETIVNGVPVTGSAAGPNGSSISALVSERTTGTISSDGEVVYFTSPPNAANGRVYRRADNATVFVNESENDDEVVAAGPATYRIASKDGKKVFFTSTQHLVEEDTNATAAAGTDLYMYTHSDNPATDENLTLLSPPTTLGGTTSVQGVFGIADDGSRVYFVAQGRLDPDAPNDSVNKAYLWESGDVSESGNDSVRYLGSLGSTLGLAFGQSLSGNEALRSVSSGGEAMMLVTSAQLDPGRDNGGTNQVYRYGIDEDRFRCISCPWTGFSSVDSRIRYLGNGGIFPVRTRGVEPSYFSADGERAVFETRDSLVPDDINGKIDVYLWEDNEQRLISSGRSEYNSAVAEITASGNDVFFTTAERLVGWDTDDSRDLYTARVEGGLEDPEPLTPPCVGDECQNAPVAPPGVTGAASSSVDAPSGNVLEPGTTSCSGSQSRARRLGIQARRARQVAARARGTQRETHLRRRASQLTRKANRAKGDVRRCKQAKREAGR